MISTGMELVLLSQSAQVSEVEVTTDGSLEEADQSAQVVVAVPVDSAGAVGLTVTERTGMEASGVAFPEEELAGSFEKLVLNTHKLESRRK